MELLFSTHNRHKLKEILGLLPPGIRLSCLADRDGTMPVEETGNTLRENAAIKANHAFQSYGMPSFADDSGLFVRALDGAPGVHSSSFAGQDASALQHVEKLLRELNGKEDRSAWFETCIAFRETNGIHFFHGKIHGIITTASRGEGGFGYDPVFLPEGEEMTFAEMASARKREISHRGKALHAFSEYLRARYPENVHREQ